MTLTTPWQRIFKVLEYSGCKSVSEFARAIGLNRAENLYQIKRGNNGISLRLAEIINVKYPSFSIGWLMIGEGSPVDDNTEPEFHMIPYFMNFSTNNIDYTPNGTIPVSKLFFPDADYATIIKNDRLEPRIPAGSLVILKNSNRIFYGSYYFIELSTGEGLYCIIRKSGTEGFVNIESCNPAYDEMIISDKEIIVLYKIIGCVICI